MSNAEKKPEGRPLPCRAGLHDYQPTGPSTTSSTCGLPPGTIDTYEDTPMRCTRCGANWTRSVLL